MENDSRSSAERYLPSWTPRVRESYGAYYGAHRRVMREIDPQERLRAQMDLKTRILNLQRTITETSGRKMPQFIDCALKSEDIFEGMEGQCLITPLYYIPAEGRMVTGPMTKSGLRRREKPDLARAQTIEDSEWLGDNVVVGNAVYGILSTLPHYVYGYVCGAEDEFPSLFQEPPDAPESSE